jgi:hypothetical protein
MHESCGTCLTALAGPAKRRIAYIRPALRGVIWILF